jgi:hypothetical protein
VIARTSYHPFLFPLLHIGSFLDTTAEEQRVDARVEILLRLANRTTSTSGLMLTALAELCDFKTAQPKFEIFLTSALVRWPWCTTLCFLGILSLQLFLI